MILIIHIICFIFLLIGLYLLAIMPKLRRNHESNYFDGRLYAHRGLHDNNSDAPENSIKAFQLAVDKQYGIELDVQLTRDKVPVVLHDNILLRVCGEDCKVSDITYEELTQYRLFESQERIPTLQEVLDCVDGRVPLIIELKVFFMPKSLCNIVSSILENYHGRYCIESFNPLVLFWYRRHCPEVIRGQLSTDLVREKAPGNKVECFILKNMVMNFLTKPDFIAYDHAYKNGLSFTLCRKLYRVKTAAWTIQSQDDYEKNRKYFDFFIFDSFIPKV
jgi:glycerophosphoryl diester phosphodiesterase